MHLVCIFEESRSRFRKPFFWIEMNWLDHKITSFCKRTKKINCEEKKNQIFTANAEYTHTFAQSESNENLFWKFYRRDYSFGCGVWVRTSQCSSAILRPLTPAHTNSKTFHRICLPLRSSLVDKILIYKFVIFVNNLFSTLFHFFLVFCLRLHA